MILANSSCFFAKIFFNGTAVAFSILCGGGMKNTADNILVLIRDNGLISISDISKKFKSKGIIERIGADKGGYWKVKGEI